MINKRFIYFKTDAKYQERLNDIPNDAIVFVEDTKKIYTHGNEFGASSELVDIVSLIGTLNVNDIDLDDDRIKEIIMNQAPTHFTVKAYRGRTAYTVGTMVMFSDNSHHQLTLVFTTNYVLDDDNKFNAHEDGEVFTYYRTYNSSAPHLDFDEKTWGPWKLKTNLVANAASQYIYGDVDLEDKTFHLNDATGNSLRSEDYSTDADKYNALKEFISSRATDNRVGGSVFYSKYGRSILYIEIDELENLVFEYFDFSTNEFGAFVVDGDWTVSHSGSPYQLLTDEDRDFLDQFETPSTGQVGFGLSNATNNVSNSILVYADKENPSIKLKLNNTKNRDYKQVAIFPSAIAITDGTNSISANIDDNGVDIERVTKDGTYHPLWMNGDYIYKGEDPAGILVEPGYSPAIVFTTDDNFKTSIEGSGITVDNGEWKMRLDDYNVTTYNDKGVISEAVFLNKSKETEVYRQTPSDETNKDGAIIVNATGGLPEITVRSNGGAYVAIGGGAITMFDKDGNFTAIEPNGITSFGGEHDGESVVWSSQFDNLLAWAKKQGFDPSATY